MKEADPSIELIACGHKGDISPEWTDVLIDSCADILDSVTVHLLFGSNADSPPDAGFLSCMGTSHFTEELFRSIHAKGREHGIDLEVAITENFLTSGRGYHAGAASMAEALSYAGILNAAIRTEGIVSIFTHTAIINHGGGLRKELGVVYPNPVYHARSALRELEGGRIAACEAAVPFAEVPERQASWTRPEPGRFPLVDVLPIVREGSVRIVFVNRHPERPIPAHVTLRSGSFASQKARITELAGDTYHAKNDPLEPNRVRLRRGILPLKDYASLRIMLRPASLTLVTADCDIASEDGLR
jgi:alpha-N-arabinofuranosidase